MDALLLPCFNRPEFLWYCLDNLTKASGIGTVHVIFSPDYGYNRDIPTVIEHFAPKLASYEVRKVSVHPYRSTKQSHNVLSGYQLAMEKSTGLVFMVEEDIMVGRDFFEFHRAVHQAEPNVFCSLSTRNHNRAVTTTTDTDAYYLTTFDYCSLGVCFRKEVIQEYIAPHITRAYYSQPGNYCKSLFPGSNTQSPHTEQDGLIRRIQEQLGPDLPIAYPHVPRAFHSGYYGYNRQRPPAGKLETKVAHLATLIYDPEAMRIASRGYADSEPVPLEIAPWTTLRRSQPPELQHLDFCGRQ